MSSQAPSEALVDELTSLRERVMGIAESLISTADGLLVTGDTATVQPESVAALSAAALALGRRTAAEVGFGGLRDVVSRCNRGYVVVLAIGDHALLVVLGDEGLDIAALHRECPTTIDRLDKLLTANAA
ncbi:roadblock/LC7 domain-containing protein [Peterkaempfera bronchialis]|uniref:Dynein regulation protein LC7 n=1 Tax=Peterkaempfera bronchialis TaxID=2126346 RepID=A0A345SVG3_9ACTN|nr:roadblock/LC7 domain-containing protein [Peterkaempfera bronchialis]AXI77718.1 dynein regulation protein LC7 [Peterkaempfera bronchialis]